MFKCSLSRIAQFLADVLMQVFVPYLNKIWRGKPQIRRTSSTRRQSEARNFEKAQHIGKQNPGVSSTINALKQQQTWAHHPTGI